jgi:murein DD-endopeptidase MepM/ murein hydrolase activator NlpD
LTNSEARCRVAASSDFGGADLNRPVSPLLHDYKPSAGSPVKKSKAIHWFAFGLGLPLAAVALVLTLGSAPADTVTMDEVQATIVASVDSDIQFVPADTSEEIVEVPPNAVFPVSFRPPLALPEPDYDSINLTIRRGDTLDRLFRQHDLNLGHLAKIVRLPDARQYLRVLRPGDEIEITHDDGDLISLYRELSLTSALRVSKEPSGFLAEIIDRPIDVRKRRAYGRIDSSLFESGNAAGLPDKLIMNLAGIFAWDIDFVLDIRAGDDYYLLYEEIYQDGEFVTDGEIIAAEFNNDGRTYQAIRFIDNDGRSDYFTPDGSSVRKAFVRAPVDFSRISSSFNPRRRHPVLNTIRAHRGVDYAAPKGTPIKAAGDGKIIFRGRKGGYGNAVIVQHGGNITTLYAHMSNFARAAPFGSRVRQGQVIGFVGSTGLATAAHLHYEYRLNGVHRNPRTVKLPKAEPIKAEYKEKFLAQAQPLLDELLKYKSMQIASLSYD